MYHNLPSNYFCPATIFAPAIMFLSLHLVTSMYIKEELKIYQFVSKNIGLPYHPTILERKCQKFLIESRILTLKKQSQLLEGRRKVINF